MGKRGANKIDLTNKRFGRYLVLMQDTPLNSYRSVARWICRCDCGTIKTINSQTLRLGQAKSCGCKERIQCIICGNFAMKIRRKNGQIKYCSNKCGTEASHRTWNARNGKPARKNPEYRPCVRCGITVLMKTNQKYCSNSCSNISEKARAKERDTEKFLRLGRESQRRRRLANPEHYKKLNKNSQQKAKTKNPILWKKRRKIANDRYLEKQGRVLNREKYYKNSENISIKNQIERKVKQACFTICLELGIIDDNPIFKVNKKGPPIRNRRQKKEAAYKLCKELGLLDNIRKEISHGG